MACMDGEAASIYLQLSGYFTNPVFVFPHSLCLKKCYFCCQGDGFVSCLACDVQMVECSAEHLVPVFGGGPWSFGGAGFSCLF